MESLKAQFDEEEDGEWTQKLKPATGTMIKIKSLFRTFKI